jgi:hypothetical protein
MPADPVPHPPPEPSARDLKELRELMSKVTPGPWKSSRARKASNFGGYQSLVFGLEVARVAAVNGGNSDTPEVAETNAALIVALRNAAPALIDELTAARADLARLREDLDNKDAALRQIARGAPKKQPKQQHEWASGYDCAHFALAEIARAALALPRDAAGKRKDGEHGWQM